MRKPLHNPNHPSDVIVARIRAAGRLRINQKLIARLTGLSPGTIRNYVQGHTRSHIPPDDSAREFLRKWLLGQ